MKTIVVALVVVVAACGSDGASQSAGPTTAERSEPSAAASEGSETLPLTQDEFIARRDEICSTGSNDIPTINHVLDGLSGRDLANGFTRIAQRIRQAQMDLDELEGPEELQDFVSADNDRRARRIALVEELGAASLDDPSAMADIDSELTSLNIETEREEDAHGSLHCP